MLRAGLKAGEGSAGMDATGLLGEDVEAATSTGSWASWLGPSVEHFAGDTWGRSLVTRGTSLLVSPDMGVDEEVEEGEGDGESAVAAAGKSATW